MVAMSSMVVAMDIITTNPARKLAPQVSLMRLLQLVSPNLPIGAFAYSQGLEQAVELGWLDDEAATAEWLDGVLLHAYSHLEIPLLARCYLAWQQQDMAAVQYWNGFLLASRESAELYEEDRLLGLNLARLLTDLGLEEAAAFKGQACSLITLFALAASRWQIPLLMAAQGLAWSWCENQVAAAIKLVPLGQTAGQRLLSRLGETACKAVEIGLTVEDEAIGQSAYGVAMVSSWHEHQYSRLFRS